MGKLSLSKVMELIQNRARQGRNKDTDVESRLEDTGRGGGGSWDEVRE